MILQIKRGRADNLPLLEDGELAFSVDTKELFAGFEHAVYNLTNRNASGTVAPNTEEIGIWIPVVNDTHYLQDGVFVKNGNVVHLYASGRNIQTGQIRDIGGLPFLSRFFHGLSGGFPVAAALSIYSVNDETGQGYNRIFSGMIIDNIIDFTSSAASDYPGLNPGDEFIINATYITTNNL